MDAYGFSESTMYVPHAQFWNCQEAKPEDGGQWAIVSADYIQESHNCIWLFGYPHQALAGGSMYAFQLPPVIPIAGAPGGPPLPANYRQFGNFPFPGDLRLIWLKCIRDPNQIQPTWDWMSAISQQARNRQSGSKN